VWASFVSAVVSWSLGVFGTSVYLHTICQSKGWSISLVSSSVTVFYLTGAACSILVGKTITQLGPRPVMLAGGLALAIGVIGMGRVSEPWHIYLNFTIIGISYACLGTTAISTTLAPWFERHQGRVVSVAQNGPSLGGKIGTP
jgi:MFS family permease